MKVEFNVPAGSGLSVSQCQDGTVDLYIKASFQEELSLEMDEESAVKVGYALLKMTGSLESSDKPKGNWLITEAWPHNVYCSNCYKTYAQADWEIWKDGSLPRAFCPTCGADMRTQGLTCRAVKELGETFLKGFEDGLNQENQK